MERRQFLQATTLIAAAALKSPAAFAAETGKKSPSPLVIRSLEAWRQLADLAPAAAACTIKADMCTQHCQDQLSKGETQFAECSIAASQMSILCTTVTKLAAAKSVRLAQVLDACNAACTACKDACEEHKSHWKHGMHLECKACAEACDKVIALIPKVKAVLA